MPPAWTYQDSHQKAKHGPSVSWYVGWLDPEGNRKCKSCGPGDRGKRTADRLANKISAELLTGTYRARDKTAWKEFRRQYEDTVTAGLAARTSIEIRTALNHFERIVKPQRVSVLTAAHVDRYIATRRTEKGKNKGEKVSPATINKELRHVKAALGVAKEWGHLAAVPKFRMEREPGKMPSYVPPADFAAIYAACDAAKRPTDLPYPAADWWQGFLFAAYMTGWRVGALLALLREDVDLDKGTAFSHWKDNKGKRDVETPLHPLLVEHLRKLPAFSRTFFPWSHGGRQLYSEFERIQQAAGVKPGHGRKRYTFHDLRRAFATMNADRLTPDALQHLMQHKDYQTTQRYIAIARQLNPAVAGLYVPDLKPGKTGEGTNRR
jgi:integrase